MVELWGLSREACRTRHCSPDIWLVSTTIQWRIVYSLPVNIRPIETLVLYKVGNVLGKSRPVGLFGAVSEGAIEVPSSECCEKLYTGKLSAEVANDGSRERYVGMDPAPKGFDVGEGWEKLIQMCAGHDSQRIRWVIPFIWAAVGRVFAAAQLDTFSHGFVNSHSHAPISDILLARIIHSGRGRWSRCEASVGRSRVDWPTRVVGDIGSVQYERKYGTSEGSRNSREPGNAGDTCCDGRVTAVSWPAAGGGASKVVPSEVISASKVCFVALRSGSSADRQGQAKSQKSVCQSQHGECEETSGDVVFRLARSWYMYLGLKPDSDHC